MPPSKRKQSPNPAIQYSYDVCLSFAGEDRVYVRQVADHLKASGVNVFFDEFEKTKLWGIDLYEHLDLIYSKLSRYCVIFCSKHYAKKLWTSHERKSAQARAFEENEPYLLPVRFDNTEIPGIRRTIGYLDLRSIGPADLAKHIKVKVRPWERMLNNFVDYQQRRSCFPRETGRLWEVLRAKTPKAQQIAHGLSHAFYESLSRLTRRERLLILCTFVFGCNHDLPTNMHINLDYLCRIARCKDPTIREQLANVRSVGFNVTFPKKTRRRRSDHQDGNLYIEWHHWNDGLAKIKKFKTSNFTGFAKTVVDAATEHFCNDHSVAQLMNLNFIALSEEYQITTEEAFCGFKEIADSAT
jgi:hypothetical protein